MSDEAPDFQSNEEPGTDEAKPLPAGTDFTSDITSMYTYIDSLERPSLINEDLIPEMEKKLNAWLAKAQAEGWENTIQDSLLDAATTASSLARYTVNEVDDRSPEFYKNLNALKITLGLLKD